jgi:hypothetical protein
VTIEYLEWTAGESFATRDVRGMAENAGILGAKKPLTVILDCRGNKEGDV